MQGNDTHIVKSLPMQYRKSVILGVCMLTYSARKRPGNALVKLPQADEHYEYRHDGWVLAKNSHLTNMEKVVIVNSIMVKA